jgi:predicted acetyltransferase
VVRRRATFLGHPSVRHQLTPELRRGKNIGYDVRPSARWLGHATAMLRAALPVAAALGIERVLPTCDAANVASRRVIKSAGRDTGRWGRPLLRYWVATG